MITNMGLCYGCHGLRPHLNILPKHVSWDSNQEPQVPNSSAQPTELTTLDYTAVVSPIYYVMFTSLTILASVIMFKDWDRQSPTQIATEMCGFVTILSGKFLLHKTKDMDNDLTSMFAMKMPKCADEEDGFGQEGIPLKRQESSRTP